MKVCVYGAGAIGTYLAARLSEGGAHVSLIARGRNLSAIRANGIRVSNPLRRFETRVEVTDDPTSVGPQDAVVVAVKAPSLPSIIDGLAALISPNTSVAFILNGIPWWYFHGERTPLQCEKPICLDPGDRLLNTVGVERTIGGVIFGGCDLVEPGVVHAENAKMRLILGHPDGRVSQNIEALGAALGNEDFTVEFTRSIRNGVWSKLQMVGCSGLFGCLTNTAPKWAYAEPACEGAVRRLFAEIGAISAAMGCPSDLNPDRLLATARGQVHLPSVAQDLKNGRPIEFDTMFGIPLEIGRLLQVPTPTLDLLATLVKLRATTAGSYASQRG